METTHVLDELRPDLDPVPARSPVRSGRPDNGDRRAQVVIATCDEVQLDRHSVAFARGRDEHRPGAAGAIATCGASAPEGPGVCWNHLIFDKADGRCIELDLARTHLHDPDSLRYQAPRTVLPDMWESRMLTLWYEEADPCPTRARPSSTARAPVSPA